MGRSRVYRPNNSIKLKVGVEICPQSLSIESLEQLYRLYLFTDTHILACDMSQKNLMLQNFGEGLYLSSQVL